MKIPQFISGRFLKEQKTMKKRRISLYSPRCKKYDYGGLMDVFRALGFRYLDELTGLRLFDVLNLNRVDGKRAKQMVLLSYILLNPSHSVDKWLETGEMDQYFDFLAWRKAHKDLSRVTTEDIVMVEGINKKAAARIYEMILRAFYRSGEYNTREYRYGGYREIARR